MNNLFKYTLGITILCLYLGQTSLVWAVNSSTSPEPLEFALFEDVPLVFSASRLAEPITEAPAAISIITAQDLKDW
jgi:outer membrane receptor for ferrienterochelin and colicin